MNFFNEDTDQCFDSNSNLPEPNDEAPGWDAINEQLEALYLGQKPKHWGTKIPYILGGEDPLDGISVYESKDGGSNHLHFCTYGFSSLYEPETPVVKDQPSGYGFELTFRLKQSFPSKEEPIWVLHFLQNLARYVFSTDNIFMEYDWIAANGPIKVDSDTELVGFAFLRDPALKPINTPNGYVEFIQVFGINQEELDLLKAKKINCEKLINKHKKNNPWLITDLSRKSGK